MTQSQQADANDEEWPPNKPSDWTYRDYRRAVEISAEAAINGLSEYPEDFDSRHAAVEYAITEDPMFTNYGLMLMTVLLSDQSPEAPDYTERWSAFVDMTGDPTWSDCVSQMARVCYYSDVYDYVERALSESES